MLLDTRVLIASVLASLVLLFWFPKWGLLGLLGLPLAWLGAVLQRRTTIQEFFAKVSALSLERPPNLVAHSFGTYLTGMILATFPVVQLRRIVLTGCVLPKRFPWQEILAQNSHAFEALRNDVAKRDIVPRLAQWLGRTLALGSSGSHGFSGQPTLIHDLTNPYSLCTHARIHNAYYPYRHKDYFLTADHAFKFWLPFLLGIEPMEFQEFIELCLSVNDMEELSPSHTLHRFLTPVAEEIRDRPWTFLRGRSLSQEVGILLGLSGSPDRIAATLRLIWHAVAEAYPLRFDSAADTSLRAPLDPYTAIALAVAAEPGT